MKVFIYFNSLENYLDDPNKKATFLTHPRNRKQIGKFNL